MTVRFIPPRRRVLLILLAIAALAGTSASARVRAAGGAHPDVVAALKDLRAFVSRGSGAALTVRQRNTPN